MKYDYAIKVLENEKDKWKRALSRLRKYDKRKGIKKEYLLHKSNILGLREAIKLLKKEGEK
jgi:hypothetical protein